MTISVSIIVYTLIAGLFMIFLFKRLLLVSHKPTKMFIHILILAFVWPGLLIVIIVGYLFLQIDYYLTKDE